MHIYASFLFTSNQYGLFINTSLINYNIFNLVSAYY